jgi:chromosome segregation ATPase
MKTIDTRDLYERKEELETLQRSLEIAKEELEGHQSKKPEDQKELEEWQEELEDLEYQLSSMQDDFGDDEKEELEELEELESAISDFKHGETMVKVDNFEEYARQLADDCGMVDHNASWPMNCIDWEKAASELEQDYQTVTYQGTDYFVRA